LNQIPNYNQARNYFEERLTTHGATPRGVDWNSDTAQELRFSQLIKVIDPSMPFSLLDYGCGYGALAEYLTQLGHPMEMYLGYDMLESMVQQGRVRLSGVSGITMTSNREDLAPADYLIASGIFNLKLDTSDAQWTSYVTGELEIMNTLCRRGFSFNMLTKYSDAEHMRPHLYYADPCYLFDYCKTHFSRNVALLHDYEAYDFTIIVRKSSV
jgi:SAM-dependent methyltransferase